ncbi:Protein of uncharacterised function (DUF2635) [Bordetella ansorpii]|uniref:Protein of uncharacterized function (DUF2635) n=1 Tax=Bordetella ansorpii TaxID=288768 RepID=A0A157SVV2_9BORD|nr:DUF2635 domain-containing protein [Bordetella ansorpii]SAI74569.1 Protein of uncharacterised function (DUF2635) [Bordetella ansorpii]
MADPVILKPAVVDGVPLRVRKPQGGYLNPSGEPVMLTTYWRRRRLDGDVVAVTETAAGKAASAKTGKAITS